MNFQKCNQKVFVGASHSYEQTYQAIRRCWRFGQTREVNVFVIHSESDIAIVNNYKRKEVDTEKLFNETSKYVQENVRNSLGVSNKEWDSYKPIKEMKIPEWLKGEIDDNQRAMQDITQDCTGKGMVQGTTKAARAVMPDTL